MNDLILTDIDEVVLNWIDPFVKWVERNYEFKRKNIDVYENIEELLSCDIHTTRKMVKEFNKDPLEFPHLKPYPDSLSNIPELKKHGYDFIGITACSSDKWTYKNRKRNLEKYFPNIFDDIICVGLGESKREPLGKFHPSIWIEDKMSHAIDGAELGHTSFIISRPHNSHYQSNQVIRVNSWDDITKHLIS